MSMLIDNNTKNRAIFNTLNTDINQYYINYNPIIINNYKYSNNNALNKLNSSKSKSKTKIINKVNYNNQIDNTLKYLKENNNLFDNLFSKSKYSESKSMAIKLNLKNSVKQIENNINSKALVLDCILTNKNKNLFLKDKFNNNYSLEKHKSLLNLNNNLCSKYNNLFIKKNNIENKLDYGITLTEYNNYNALTNNSHAQYIKNIKLFKNKNKIKNFLNVLNDKNFIEIENNNNNNNDNFNLNKDINNINTSNNKTLDNCILLKDKKCYFNKENNSNLNNCSLDKESINIKNSDLNNLNNNLKSKTLTDKADIKNKLLNILLRTKKILTNYEKNL